MNSQDRNGEKPGKRPRHSRRSLLGSAALSVTALALAVPAVAAFSGSETGSATDQIANTATTAELSATLQGQTVSVDGEEGSKGAALAELLGVEQSELRDALRSGESLGDFAAANGVERQVVVDELVSNMNERIDRGVENGRVTAEQAAEMKAGAVERAEAIVDGDAPLRGGKGRHGPRGGPGNAPAAPEQAPALEESDPQLL